MTKDNNILGSFSIDGIPPNLAGVEKFTVVLDLNADGILTATATHNGSGKSKFIKINANSRGRLSVDEINELIEKADKMKIYDEIEENRVHARNRIEAFCRNLQLELKEQKFQKTTQLNIRTLRGAVKKKNSIFVDIIQIKVDLPPSYPFLTNLFLTKC